MQYSISTFLELVTPPPPVKLEPEAKKAPSLPPQPEGFEMTEDEERELAELMGDD